MKYPSMDEEAYSSWEYPEHECDYTSDRNVECGALEDGVLRVYEIQYCTQCPSSRTVKTDRIARQPKR